LDLIDVQARGTVGQWGEEDVAGDEGGDDDDHRGAHRERDLGTLPRSAAGERPGDAQGEIDGLGGDKVEGAAGDESAEEVGGKIVVEEAVGAGGRQRARWSVAKAIWQRTFVDSW
jgi:hypothetical protein